MAEKRAQHVIKCIGGWVLSFLSLSSQRRRKNVKQFKSKSNVRKSIPYDTYRDMNCMNGLTLEVELRVYIRDISGVTPKERTEQNMHSMSAYKTWYSCLSLVSENCLLCELLWSIAKAKHITHRIFWALSRLCGCSREMLTQYYKSWCCALSWGTTHTNRLNTCTASRNQSHPRDVY